jgi:hypothetical protein
MGSFLGSKMGSFLGVKNGVIFGVNFEPKPIFGAKSV